MDIERLRDIAEEFLWSTYQIKLEIPIVINNRLRASLGCYITSWKTDAPDRIELSGSLIRYGHEDVVIDVLKHELVHYALHLLGLPSYDGDEYFENELKRLDVCATERYYVGELHKCQCAKCNKKIVTRVKSEFKSGKYISRCCKGKIEYIETLIFNGTEEFVTH